MNIFKTACRDCIFSIKKSNTNSQIDCKFKRLEGFSKHGGINLVSEKYVDIKDVVDNNIPKPREYSLDEYNYCRVLCKFDKGENKGVIAEPEQFDESYYYELSRLCNRFRNSFWAKKNKDENLEELVCKESAFQFTFLIYLDKTSNLQDFKECLDSIKAQTLPPIQIITANNECEIKEDVLNLLDACGLPWCNVNINEKKCTKNWMLDEAYLKITTTYLAQIELPCIIKSDLVKQLDLLINDDMERFVLARIPNNPNIFITTNPTIKNLNGNLEMQFEENGEYVSGIQNKIEWIAKKNKQEFLIKTL